MGKHCPQLRQKVIEKRSSGHSYGKIADDLWMSRSNVQYICKRGTSKRNQGTGKTSKMNKSEERKVVGLALPKKKIVTTKNCFNNQ